MFQSCVRVRVRVAWKFIPLLLALAGAVSIFGGGTVPPRVQAAGTVIVVDTTVDEDEDNGTCSLREAIMASNGSADYNGCVRSGSGEDVIVFALGPGTSTITIGSPLLPPITETVTIDGGSERVESSPTRANSVWVSTWQRMG